MSPLPRRDIAASVRQRLLNLSRERGEEFQYLLNRYGVERLLYRLSQSPYRDRFLLKGATLFGLWSAASHRATRDLDLLGWGSDDPEEAEIVFREVCRLEVEEDGLQFNPESVKAEAIHEEAIYGGVRVKLIATLGVARAPLQVDIGFGDVVVPPPAEADYPSLLGFPSPRLKVYPKETVVAEKLQIIVALGWPNSRLKDFYDLWCLCRNFEFEGGLLSQAIRATFERRGTPFPHELPIALSEAFARDGVKQRQWQAFLERSLGGENSPSLLEVIQSLHIFTEPPFEALLQSRPFKKFWALGGPWKDEE